MIIMGIDPGTARMGCGFVELSSKNKLSLVGSEVLITSPEIEQHLRLKFLHTQLTKLCKQFEPDVMVIEKLFFNSNAKTAMNVGQARGVSMLVAATQKLKLFEYTALEAKCSVADYGRADKKQMQEAVKKKLNLSTIIKSDDANDAVAMALCYVYKELMPKEAAGFKAKS